MAAPTPGNVVEIPQVPICFDVITRGLPLFGGCNPGGPCGERCASGIYSTQFVPRPGQLPDAIAGCSDITCGICSVHFYNCLDHSQARTCPGDSEYPTPCLEGDLFDESTGCCAPVGTVEFPRCGPGLIYDGLCECCVPGTRWLPPPVIIPPPPPGCNITCPPGSILDAVACGCLTPTPSECTLVCASPLTLDPVACRCVDPPTPKAGANWQR